MMSGPAGGTPPPLEALAKQPGFAEPDSARKAIVAWIGVFVVIGCIWPLFAAQELAFVATALGGSAAILFLMPESQMAQPRSLVGGHLVASLCGLLFFGWFGNGIFSIAAAMASAAVIMQLTRTVHPPAGADPIIVMTSAMTGPTVMLNLGVGLAVLWLVALLLLNGAKVNPYCSGLYRKISAGPKAVAASISRSRRR